MTAIRNHRGAVFAALAALVLAVEWTVTRSAAFARGGAVPVAVFADVVLGLPLLFGLVVLRPAGRPVLDVAPVLALGVLIAGVLLGTRPETRTLVRVFGPLSEVAVV